MSDLEHVIQQNWSVSSPFNLPVAKHFFGNTVAVLYIDQKHFFLKKFCLKDVILTYNGVLIKHVIQHVIISLSIPLRKAVHYLYICLINMSNTSAKHAQS